MLEIAALSAIVPVLVVLRQWASSSNQGEFHLRNIKAKKDFNEGEALQGDQKRHVIEIMIDFFSVVLPMLLFFTVLAEWVYIFAFFLMILLLVCILHGRSSTLEFSEGPESLNDIRKSISSYRVSVVIVTCLCILAVDFTIFPRRYAKTETYGTGLMDLGVGSFIVVNSLVSRQARGVSTIKLKYAIKSVCPLLILGFGRLIFTKGVDYQVHVGEYGVHWNFFFTLAAVAILSSIFNIHPRHCGVCGLFILIGYQASLISGLGGYLLSNERSSNIISQNKEGIYSVFGYWGMYLLGVHLGYHVFFQESSSEPKSFRRARTSVWTLAALFWSLTIFSDMYVERISRRTCNLSYVLFVFALNFEVMSILMVSNSLPGRRPLILEQAFNQNLLGSFILANILTGMVNLYVDTLSAPPLSAFAVLFGYAFLLTSVVGFVFHVNIKLKFW